MISLPLLVCLLLITFARVSDAYRILSSSNDPVKSTPAVFEPYVHGQAGYYGDPLNPDPERINEGGPFSPDTPRIFLYGAPKQNCPGMVGPINEQEYYCHGREYGYCDRRSGLCVCNKGYMGLDCTDCKPSYFKKGGLCYPKKSCPNDCSRAGVCDYTTGICTCALNRKGLDCSTMFCDFDVKCTSCTTSKCLTCIESYYVDPATNKCASCKAYDPRCLVCNSSSCLQCADPILNSIRRSGAREVDIPLPSDELTREFSFSFPYGSQDPRVFDEAEPFTLMTRAPGGAFLNEKSQTCTQGMNMDATLTCTSFTQSHRVCGHAGVFSFTSPIYAVSETAQTITLTVRRSGGGLGASSVSYDLQHITTSNEDVSPTAFYTSSQVLNFADGVVELSFKLTIHDDHQVDNNGIGTGAPGDETFRVLLRNPSDGSSLGNQREALVTILDDDVNKTDASLTYVVPTSGTILANGGNAGDSLTFQIQAVLGNGAVKTTGNDVFIMESYIADESSGDENDVSSIYRTKISGVIADLGSGLYTCAWNRTLSGNYTVAVYLLYSGGLRGDYYTDAWFDGGNGTTTVSGAKFPLISRIDRNLNFTWQDGPLFPGAADYVTVRWSGRIAPKATGDVTFYIDCDDHVRLWIGDILLVDRWSIENDSSGSGLSVQATIYMDSRIYYSIVVEYRELTDTARIRLRWSGVGFTIEDIPSANLFTAQHIKGSPFAPISISSAPGAHPTTSYIQGILSTIAGIPLIFRLYPVDIYGNFRTVHNPKVDVYEALLTLVTDQSLGGMGSKQVACDLEWKGANKQFYFVVTCVPFFSGIHNLDIFINNVKITGAPFAVTVTPNRMNPTRSVLSGSGIQANRVAGVTTTVQLETRDLYNNRIYTGNIGANAPVLALRAVHTTITALHGGVEIGTVTDNNDGTYTFQYTPRFVGTYSVQITQSTTASVHIHNSPYIVSVIQNVPVGSTSVATAVGSSLTTAVTNVQSSFNIQVRDLNGNDIKTSVSGTIFQVTLIHPTLASVSGSCTDLANGLFSCVYTPKFIGTCKLQVGLLQGATLNQIDGSPFSINVVAGVALGSQSYATGGALVTSVAGQEMSFAVSIRDSFGNDKVNAGLEVISVSFQGPSPSLAIVPSLNTGVRVVYANNGQFVVYYTLQTKGQYKITVQVDGVGIIGSPFTMYSYPSVAAITTSIDLISPIPAGVPPVPTYIAGTIIQTKITTRDAYHNVLETGGYQFQFATEFTSPTFMIGLGQLVDLLDGTYTYQFTPKIARNYALGQRLMLAGGLNGSYYIGPDPFAPNSFPTPLERVDSTIDFDFGVQSPTGTNAMESFGITWRGYLLPQYSERYTFSVQLIGGIRMRVQNTLVDFVDNKDKLLDSWPIASHMKMSSRGIDLVANELVPIEVNFSKPKSMGNATIQLLWSSLSLPIQVVPASQLYTGWTFVDNVPSLNIVPNVPYPPAFTVDFPISSLDPNTNVADKTTIVSAVAGQLFTFQVTACDQYGNPQLQGGDRITVLFPQLAEDTNIEVIVQDFDNSSYAVSFTPIQTGTFSMVIAASRANVDIGLGTGTTSLIDRLRPSNFVQGSPFTLVVQANQPLATTSTFVGEGIYTAIAGVPAFFMLELRDVYNNQLVTTPATTSEIEVELRQVNTTGVIINCVQDSSSRFPVTGSVVNFNYTALVTGVYEVWLRMQVNDAFIQKSSMLRVYSNVASPQTSTVSGTGLGPQVAVMSVMTYNVQLRDAYQNVKEEGGDNLAITLEGPDTVYGDVTDLSNGQYIVTYQLTIPGLYRLHTTLANNGLGSGLVGYYFENTRYDALEVAHAVHWVDPVLDFDWSLNDTMRNYPRIQWRGYIKPLYTEVYTIRLSVVPAGAVYIDNIPVIDAINTPLEPSQNYVEGIVPLVAGRSHQIRVEYRSPSQREVVGSLRVEWKSARQTQQTIPSTALLPDGQEILPQYIINAV